MFVQPCWLAQKPGLWLHDNHKICLLIQGYNEQYKNCLVVRHACRAATGKMNCDVPSATCLCTLLFCCYSSFLFVCFVCLVCWTSLHPLDFIEIFLLCCVAAEEYKHMLDQSPSTNPAHDHSHKYTNFMLCTGYMLMRWFVCCWLVAALKPSHVLLYVTPMYVTVVNAVIHEYTIIPSFLLLLEIRHTVDLDIFVYPFFVPVNFCCI